MKSTINQVISVLEAYKKTKVEMKMSTDEFLVRLNMLYLSGDILLDTLNFSKDIISSDNNNINNVTTYNSSKKYTIIWPNGTIHNVNSLADFCRKNGFKYYIVRWIMQACRENVSYNPESPIYQNWKIVINR